MEKDNSKKTRVDKPRLSNKENITENGKVVSLEMQFTKKNLYPSQTVSLQMHFTKRNLYPSKTVSLEMQFMKRNLYPSKTVSLEMEENQLF
jgi:hypothetical protein